MFHRTPQISQIDQERFFKEHVLKRDLTESSNVQYLKDRLKPADVLFCYGLVDLIEPLTRQAQLNSLLELVKIGGKVVFAMSCDSPLQYGKPLKGFTCEMQVASGSQHDANQNYVPEIKHMQSFVGKLEEKSFREKIKEMIEHLPAVVTEVHECTSMSESDTTQYSKWYNEAQNELAKKQSAPRPDDLLKAVETRRLAHCGKLESNTAEQTSVTESKGFYRHIGTYRNLIVLQKTDNAIPVARGQGASGVSVDKPDVQKSKPRQIARMTTGGKGPRKTLKKK